MHPGGGKQKLRDFGLQSLEPRFREPADTDSSGYTDMESESMAVGVSNGRRLLVLLRSTIFESATSVIIFRHAVVARELEY